ncbi:MAG: zinc transporter ZntB [Zetaproteobacteria bacterium CG_4_9_14_3_um_filter_53_7]|nr:MAG: zinc transporter ZntB [Zetaproteobacteria bacterium CG_4_9_14_3_um_filter_53_7]
MSAHGYMIDAWDFSSGSPKQLCDFGTFTPNCWYHCQRTDEKLPAWLASIGVSHELIQAIVAEDTRPRFQKVGEESFFMILRGVNLNPGAEPDDMLTLGLLYHQGSLITLRRRQFRAILSLRESLEKGEGPESVADLFVCILELLNARISDVLHLTETFIDDVEDQIDSLNRSQQQELTQMHRRLLKLNRFLRPQTAALDALAQANLPLLTHASQRLLNQKDTAQAISETITSYLDYIWVLREHMQQALSEAMNRNSYWLSMVAGVFLPLGFLTGLFGINIAGMPGTDDPTAFALFCAGLGLLGAIEYLLFRRLKFL